MADTTNKKQVNVLLDPDTLKALKRIQDQIGQELGFAVSLGAAITMLVRAHTKRKK